MHPQNSGFLVFFVVIYSCKIISLTRAIKIFCLMGDNYIGTDEKKKHEMIEPIHRSLTFRINTKPTDILLVDH